MVIFASIQNANNSDRTVMVAPEVLDGITGELASVTNKNGSTILPNDLSNILNTVEAILR